MLNPRAKMTPEEARQFDGVSVANYAMAKAAFASCGCEPYADVFTFNRWRAQGYYVRRGEHGVKLPIIKSRTVEDRETGDEKTIKIMGSSHVFCRHQVESTTKRQAAA
jgi:hypothetical protein